MPLSYAMSEPALPPPNLTGASAALGRDLLFQDDYQVAPNGDYAVVDRIDAATQSVINEMRTDPGEVAMVPDFGIGLVQALYETNSTATRSEMEAKAIARCQVNPRLDNVQSVTVATDPTTTGKVTTTVIATALNQPINVTLTGGPA